MVQNEEDLYEAHPLPTVSEAERNYYDHELCFYMGSYTVIKAPHKLDNFEKRNYSKSRPVAVNACFTLKGVLRREEEGNRGPGR